MLLNFAWSPVFFGLQNAALALVIIVFLVMSIAAFTWRARRIDRVSAVLFTPYLAWTAFAMTLNAAIWWMN